jgi:hypothetical protein
MSTYKLISENSAGDFDEHLIENGGILDIVLANRTGQDMVCSFDSPLAYRKLDEGDAFEALQDIKASSELGALLYLVENSDFLIWFQRTSGGKYAGRNIQHYCLTTINSVIDVLSFAPPSFR